MATSGAVAAAAAAAAVGRGAIPRLRLDLGSLPEAGGELSESIKLAALRQVRGPISAETCGRDFSIRRRPNHAYCCPKPARSSFRVLTTLAHANFSPLANSSRPEQLQHHLVLHVCALQVVAQPVDRVQAFPTKIRACGCLRYLNITRPKPKNVPLHICLPRKCTLEVSPSVWFPMLCTE